MKTLAAGSLISLALLVGLSGCANHVRELRVPRKNLKGPDYGAMVDPQADQVFRVIDGFPRANTEQQVELALFFKDRTPDSGLTYALVGREGFLTLAGDITESPTPACVQIHHSVPTLRASNGWIYINGQQSIVETDKTTIHTWGTRVIVWARPKTADRPRQDVVISLDNPVCVTPGVDLGITGGSPCSGTTVPMRNYVTVTYNDDGTSSTSTPQPTRSITDQETLDFIRYVRRRADEFGV